MCLCICVLLYFLYQCMRKTVCAVVRAQSPYCAACLLTHSTSARVSHCWQSSAQLYLYCAVLSVFVNYTALKHCRQPPSQAVHRQALIYPHISSTLNVSSHNQQTAQQPASKVAPSKPFPLKSQPKIWPKFVPQPAPAVQLGWKCLCWPFSTKWLHEAVCLHSNHAMIPKGFHVNDINIFEHIFINISMKIHDEARFMRLCLTDYNTPIWKVESPSR